MQRKFTSVDLQQDNTHDRVAGLFLVKLKGEAGNWDNYFRKIDLRRQVWLESFGQPLARQYVYESVLWAVHYQFSQPSYY